MTSTTDDATRVADKIAALPAFIDIATRLHEVITAAAPDLEPRLWYGMPGYAHAKNKPVIVFFRVDADDYVTLGVSEKAHLAVADDASHQLIESAWFLTGLDPATERRIAEIVRGAAGIDSMP